MLPASFMVPAILAGGLVFGWIFARWLERRLDRGFSASSEELLDELEMAYTPRRSIEVRSRPDQVPRYLARVVENVDSGFGERQARHLHGRIIAHRTQAVRHAYFRVKVNGIRTDLDLQWSRDGDERVRLLILAVPKIIRAIKRQEKEPLPFLPAPALATREHVHAPAVEAPPLQSPAGG